MKTLIASPAYLALGAFGAPGAWASGAPTSAADALDVFDLRGRAREVLPPAHFGYLATGTHGGGTVRANRSAFDAFYLRARRLVDVSSIDTRQTLFGVEHASPVFLCPAASQRAFHPEGELATARAARATGQLMMLATGSSTPIEAVIEARDAPVWFQLYPSGTWAVTRKLLARAEAAGCPAVVLTVDLPAGPRGRHGFERRRRLDERDCASCHHDPKVVPRRKPTYDGIDLRGVERSQAALTWSFLDRLRDATPMKLLVKGIVTAEDAERCIVHGADGIVVSNHGGRAEDSGRGAIESLEEVATAVRARVPILMDGGVRRGTDVVKALALGASAVGIGRPYLWGLAAFGQVGVRRSLGLLQRELVQTMQFVGTPSIASIDRATVGSRH